MLHVPEGLIRGRGRCEGTNLDTHQAKLDKVSKDVEHVRGSAGYATHQGVSA